MNAHADARPRAEVGAEVDASKGSERRGDMGVCDLRPVKSGGESFHDMNAPPRRQLHVSPAPAIALMPIASRWPMVGPAGGRAQPARGRFYNQASVHRRWARRPSALPLNPLDYGRQG